MPSYESPGVYFEVAEPVPWAVRGVVEDRERTVTGKLRPERRWRSERTVTAFLGYAESGPFWTPVRITNWRQYVSQFGGYLEGAYLTYAVQGFFMNGGSECVVVRFEGTDIDESLEVLSALDDVSLYCAPDIVTEPDPEKARNLRERVVAACEAKLDRMAILDVPPDVEPRHLADLRGGQFSTDSAAAAVYYPWIVIRDPLTYARRAIPPSGYIAGVYARVDAIRGFHHSPANESVNEAHDVAVRLGQNEIELLHPRDINPLVYSPSRGVVVWGGRTMSSDPDWRYIRRRRLLQFVVRNIRESTGWAALRRIDTDVPARVAADIADFLHLLWRSGALRGETEDDAYAVTVDEEDQQSGRFTVSCVLGIERDVALPLYVHFFCDG
jgi:hypothetical protein